MRLLAWLGVLAVAVVTASTLALALFLLAAHVGNPAEGDQQP